MSLGGGASTALDTAVRNAISGGVTFAVAAGNENQNACNTSPARTLEAITVGAHDKRRCALVVLQLWQLCRHLCAGLWHHVRILLEQ